MRKKIWSRVFLAATVLWIAFIFTNSLMPADVSGKISIFLSEKIESLLRNINIGSAESQNGADTPMYEKSYTSKNIARLSSEKKIYTANVSDNGNLSLTEIIKNTTREYFQLFDTNTGGNANATMRKIAHFSEFLVLAILFGIYCVLGMKRIPKFRYKIIYILFLVLFVASCDEFIQVFADERGPRVQDILIDFSGGLIGLTAVCAVRLIMKPFEKRELKPKKKA